MVAKVKCSFFRGGFWGPHGSAWFATLFYLPWLVGNQFKSSSQTASVLIRENPFRTWRCQCGGFHTWGYPKNGGFIEDTPVKMDEHGRYPISGPPMCVTYKARFWEPPSCCSHRCSTTSNHPNMRPHVQWETSLLLMNSWMLYVRNINTHA